MFNLRKQSFNKAFDDKELIQLEMDALGLSYVHDNTYELSVGDELISCSNLSECSDYLRQAKNELQMHLWENWQDLSHLALLIQNNNAGNEASLDNIFFLNSVKKSYLLSNMFSELQEVSDSIRGLFDIDVIEVHDNLISKFNTKYLEIKLLHYLIMNEIYRLQLIHRYQKMTKQAQISGPWANLDLPMSERVWSYAEDEEYFNERTKARKEQVRYNPETNNQGFYYVWQDLNRDPYRFDDMKKDSPYKSRLQLTIP